MAYSIPFSLRRTLLQIFSKHKVEQTQADAKVAHLGVTTYHAFVCKFRWLVFSILNTNTNKNNSYAPSSSKNMCVYK